MRVFSCCKYGTTISRQIELILRLSVVKQLVLVWFTKEKENKSERRMPWLPETTKDVVSCEKSRGSANRNWSANIRMGQPTGLKIQYTILWWVNPGNWNILVPGGRERNIDSQSSGDRNGKSLNRRRYGAVGVVGVIIKTWQWTGSIWKVAPQGVKVPYG